MMLAGRALYEERLREAQIARRFLRGRRAGKMSALLKGLLLIFL